MSDVVDRVTKLIALASSPNAEEARTAAHKACALIREHKLVVEAREEDKESSWIDDLREERGAGPVVHLSSNGHTAACGAYLGNGVNFFWMDKIPTLRKCCSPCVRALVGSRRRRT